MNLIMYNDEYQTLVNNYCLSERKLRYVREPKIAISLMKKDPQRYAVLALENDHLVAFLTLYEAQSDDCYANDEKNLFVQDISADYRHLNNGYTKQALELLPEFIHQHFPTINQLTIIVNEDKSFTKALCRHSGFKTIESPLPSIYGSRVFKQVSI